MFATSIVYSNTVDETELCSKNLNYVDELRTNKYFIPFVIKTLHLSKSLQTSGCFLS